MKYRKLCERTLERVVKIVKKLDKLIPSPEIIQKDRSDALTFFGGKMESNIPGFKYAVGLQYASFGSKMYDIYYNPKEIERERLLLRYLGVTAGADMDGRQDTTKVVFYYIGHLENLVVEYLKKNQKDSSVDEYLIKKLDFSLNDDKMVILEFWGHMDKLLDLISK